VSAREAAVVVEQRAPGFRPRLGLVLGSGLGALADELADVVTIPYAELPGFRAGTVAGHAGALSLGRLGDVPVACLRGRSHLYEGADATAITTPVRLLKLLGADAVLLTNAAGSLRPKVGPGSLVAISDHINMLGFNPLTGLNDDEVGPRFPSMAGAYDEELRVELARVAAHHDVPWREGVYLACPGPSFETPAEIRAFRTLGADLVGMSTVPEVIAARHCGLRVAAVSVVTNLAEGMSAEPLSHEQTLAEAERGGEQLRRMLPLWVGEVDAVALGREPR
jgi:xanthosine phosphorylase